MATVVVPFRSTDPKRRLATLSDRDRARLAEAMLADVLAAGLPVGPVLVVAPEAPELPGRRDARRRPAPRPGCRRARRARRSAGLGLAAPYLVVNADLPCATTRDLLALAGAVPDGGLALVAAADGTTNALALSDERLFEPLYGPGSAERFAALGGVAALDAPNLMDDVDAPDDLARLGTRLGPHTRRVLATLRLESAA